MFRKQLDGKSDVIYTRQNIIRGILINSSQKPISQINMWWSQFDVKLACFPFWEPGTWGCSQNVLLPRQSDLVVHSDLHRGKLTHPPTSLCVFVRQYFNERFRLNNHRKHKILWHQCDRSSKTWVHLCHVSATGSYLCLHWVGLVGFCLVFLAQYFTLVWVLTQSATLMIRLYLLLRTLLAEIKSKSWKASNSCQFLHSSVSCLVRKWSDTKAFHSCVTFVSYCDWDMTSKTRPVRRSCTFGGKTEEADDAAASNFSMNEVWENTSDQ